MFAQGSWGETKRKGGEMGFALQQLEETVVKVNAINKAGNLKY